MMERLHATAELNIYGSDTVLGFISVDRWSCSNSDTEARANARKDRIQLEALR